MTKPLSVAEADAIITAQALFALEEVEINGLKHKSWARQPPTFRAHLVPAMERWADRTFVDAPLPEPAPKEQRASITYGEALRQAYAVAGWLRARGVRVGSKVGIVGFNSINWAVSWIAIHLVGAVPVMVNAALTPDAMIQCLEITHPTVVLADAQSADTLAPASDRLRKAGVGDVYSYHPNAHLRHAVPVIDFATLVAENSPAADEVRRGLGLDGLGPDSDGTIFFTSGTTGYPKAVLSSQRAGIHNLLSSYVAPLRAALRMGAPIKMAMALAMAQDNPPVTLLAIPLFHATGCYGQLVRGIHDGGKIVLLRRWDVDDAVKQMIAHKVDIIGGVPAVPNAILQSGKLPANYPMRGISYGGAAPPARLAADLAKTFPAAGAATGWGMTETNAIHCLHAGPDYVGRPTSCGPPMPTTLLRIVDPETRKDLPRGTAGLVLAKGPNIMIEYYGNPKATAEVLDKDGWLDTGDGGYIDDEGWLFITDRIKDIIIRGGENIPSTEVENAVFADSRVGEAAAVPIPDDALGEVVGVAVSLRPGAKATGDELIALTSPKLRFQARPVFIWVSDTVLDRNANGKLVKKDIKAKVLAAYKRSKGKL
ncbi:hypothetical protein VHUM_03100 [Vanrija humicola]|uniref:AMP-dependent synthetase/ligase domain-containing protein n=1 Tax=Vanrija humicola TaxID=5417 RepID=A0A7D8YXQ7_VANHU|nr:hypothetical protein VHUM_03100 [Vanrija humicola]